MRALQEHDYKLFLKKISEKHNIDYDILIEKYLKPEYYLPIISSSIQGSKNT
jgi:hypothetical protein